MGRAVEEERPGSAPTWARGIQRTHREGWAWEVGPASNIESSPRPPPCHLHVPDKETEAALPPLPFQETPEQYFMGLCFTGRIEPQGHLGFSLTS